MAREWERVSLVHCVCPVQCDMEGLQTRVTCDRARLRRVHECDEAANEAVVLERLGACLQAVAIDSHWQVLGHVPTGAHGMGMGFAYPDPYLTNPYPVPVRVLPTHGNP